MIYFVKSNASEGDVFFNPTDDDDNLHSCVPHPVWMVIFLYLVCMPFILNNSDLNAIMKLKCKEIKDNVHNCSTIIILYNIKTIFKI